MANGYLDADDALAGTTAYFTAPRVLEFTAKFAPVNDQGVGFGVTFSDYPYAAFTTGTNGMGIGIYPRGGFVHIDVRSPPSYRWTDYSGHDSGKHSKKSTGRTQPARKPTS